MPADLEFTTFKNVSTSGHPGLCKKIKYISEERDNPSVSMLLYELSMSFDLAVSPTPFSIGSLQ
jgi:hypothetical protein